MSEIPITPQVAKAIAEIMKTAKEAGLEIKEGFINLQHEDGQWYYEKSVTIGTGEWISTTQKRKEKR